MSLFQWDPAYSVGCAEIDQQHQQLFQMADDLHRAMTERRGKEAAARLMTRLVAYTKYHFASEEKRMAASGYSLYLQHRDEHSKLTDRVIVLQEKVNRGEAALSVDVLHFLSDWLKHHIQGSDQRLGAHLRAVAA